MAKWLVDTYALVDEQAKSDSKTMFDPYRILKITNDGSFNTKEIKKAYKDLAK